MNATGGRTLTYTPPWGAKKGTSVALLSHPGLERWQEFACLDSLRDVEPTVKLVIDDGGLDETMAASPEEPEEQAASEGDDEE